MERMARTSLKQRTNTRRPKERSSPERQIHLSNSSTSYYRNGAVQKASVRRRSMLSNVVKLPNMLISRACGVLFKPISWTIAGTKLVYKKITGSTENRSVESDGSSSIDVENPIEDEYEAKYLTGSSRRAFENQVKRYQKDLVDEKSGYDELQRQIQTYEWEIEKLRRQIASKETEIVKLQRSHQNEVENLRRRKDEVTITLEAEIVKLQRSHQNEVDNLRRRKDEVTFKLEAEKKAREQITNRLSKALSSQLTDNNPNIADLSDTNRPTKLAEQFSELYDNEWTNVYGVLEESHDEYAIVSILLNILQKCFSECRRHAANQLTAAKLKTSGQKKNISPAECKHLKDEIKKTAQLTLPFIIELIENFLENTPDRNLFTDKDVKNYVQRCSKLCWLMAVQDPPMALTAGVPEDLTYNKAYHREYTKSGKFVKYVVWPAILIQDDGALMAKGIVQCCDNAKESRLRD